MVEERDPDLNKMEDIRFDGIREDHWRDLAEEKDNKKKIHTLRWNLYVKEKEELITGAFWYQCHIPKVGKLYGLA